MLVCFLDSPLMLYCVIAPLLTVIFFLLQNKPMGFLVLTMICKTMWARSRSLC